MSVATAYGPKMGGYISRGDCDKGRHLDSPKLRLALCRTQLRLADVNDRAVC